MKAVEVRSLCKSYGAIRAVEDLTFDVEAGEIFGYLGPNGAGKTTTIRCLMGLLRPTRGECYLLGDRVEAGRATRHSQIGYLPGDFRIWPELTARRALGMLAALNDGSKDGSGITAQGEQLAARLGLNPDRPTGDLSKGNRQKVGVIYAFQHQPRLLILDEPTSGLDPLLRQIVLDLIREAAAAGATVLLSSHDLNEVAAVCDRAAILREGRLVELAPISKIVQQGERRLKVWFIDGAGVPELPADAMPAVRVIHREPGALELAYQGPADGILKWLSHHAVDRIATPETSLEEAFIQYYREKPPRPTEGRDDVPREGGAR